MVIWQQTVSDFKSLLETQGAFRNVQIWGFSIDEKNGEIQLHAGIGPGSSGNITRNARELIDSSGQRVIMVVSDCVSPAWDDGRVTEMMNTWADTGMVAIVQVLPHWLWDRSGLGSADFVYFRALIPGAVNTQLEREQFREWFDEKTEKILPGLQVPVINLEHLSLLPWARFLA
ncbi:MAG: hypothetical protein GY749_29765, partial [Desulfobacteraceae bacterium]|nr:hypothetical protein [Desulfobacteraceae bacterium]